MMKDSIDFGREDITSLFKKMLFPTLLGMLFTALFIITDGIFVGKGLGSDALGAVNIVAPIWLFATGIGLMFGMGASVVASIHLSKGKVKTARINITQAVVVSSLILIICSALVLIFKDTALSLLGCSERLKPLASNYMMGFIPFLAINTIMCSGSFFIRLDGSPNYAMAASIIAAILNALLDYLFIFVFSWGMFGAAIATSAGSIFGSTIILVYLLKKSNNLHFVPIKMSRNSLLLTIRNVRYMCNLGFPSFLCEMAIACMMVCGNFFFMKYLQEAGVAAFSIACYFFPIVFMLYNAIAQSAQPIISYNYGIGDSKRVRKTLLLALKIAITSGIILFSATTFFSNEIVSLFLDQSENAHTIATNGLPLFALGFIPFAINIVSIGYFQSVERTTSAISTTVMRGFVFMVACFCVMPIMFSIEGIWLAVPMADLLTILFVIVIYMKSRSKLEK